MEDGTKESLNMPEYAVEGFGNVYMVNWEGGGVKRSFVVSEFDID